ncbi:uroporphyrinogen-III synthase [Gluconobacter morbifer]|uniref:Putative uroporphyrinogen-III synthase n=1 Tax=Gluconobacter morbifer G707 TaxID=1088869 RepID=G6XGH7_9PROT|nr:uroporphyrinogen-III synthase [Gluconobacter morbifer]EHH69285.1 putative uroporphyrinogen-III synthase [Gluconobacter morbifer G707]
MMRRRVLVTRPEPGLTATMAAVRGLGWDAVASPMLAVTPCAPIPCGTFRAILVTSANALPALCAMPRDRLLVAVGDRTAARAREAGFRNVEAAEGDAEALAAFCHRNGLTGRDVLLASGQGYGLDLVDALDVSRAEAYAVTKIRHLTPEARMALDAGAVDAVLFYSGKTAEAFMEAARDVPESCLSGIRALCLSEAIAARLEPEQWRAVRWPDPLERLGPCEA